MMKNTNLILSGKNAIVTGGSQGIGKATAIKLAKLGAKVHLIARSKSAIELVVSEISSLGNMAQGFCIDVSDKQQIDDFLKNTLPAIGGVDIYVNNAAITAMKSFVDTTEDEINNIIDINLKGSIFFLQGIAKQMIKQKRGGNIVVMTSVNGISPLPSQAVYSSTKAALESLVKSLAYDLAKESIRVNSIAPGAIRTPMNDMLTPQEIAKFSAGIPLGKFGEAEDIADVVGFLVSEEAKYITGSTIVADGGILLRGE